MQEIAITLDDQDYTFVGPFRCVGSVRGACGHKHSTLSGAIACNVRDQSGCKSQGGYSDRHVVDSAGEIVPTEYFE